MKQNISKMFACWSWRLSLLLLALATVSCLAAQSPLPLTTDICSTGKFSNFQAALKSYVRALDGQELRAAYSAYLTASRLPYTPFRQEKADLFKASLQWLLQHGSGKKLTYAVGPNLFSQMTGAERAKYLDDRLPSSSRTPALNGTKSLPSAAAGPDTAVAQDDVANTATDTEAAFVSYSRIGQELRQDSISWVAALPSVWQQGACGAGWAFAAVALAEAASYRKTCHVRSLSNKQVASCTSTALGCRGGSIEQALQYIVNAGLTTSSFLPYSSSQDSCPKSDLTPASKLASYTALQPNNESAILSALKKGPVAAAVSVDDAFLMYAGGVYSSDACSSIPPNHAVVIVGSGYDKELKLPFFQIRNSWGEGWGEAGYMRILRTGKQKSPGMCNIASSAYEAVSADEPSGATPQQADATCVNQTITVTATTSLARLALEHNTTLARIQIDNGITDPMKPLTDGQKLLITCNTGFWSEVFGRQANKQLPNAMVAAPAELVCSTGYVVQLAIRSSQQYLTIPVSSVYVGSITMTCSDGTKYTLDAQPSTRTRANGTVLQAAGFTSVSLSAGRVAVDNLFGVGGTATNTTTFKCPSGTIITGLAGGAAPKKYPKSWVSSLQWRCSNPFGDNEESRSRLQELLQASYAKVPSGMACKAYTAMEGDTWQSITSKNKVLVTELIRSNSEAANVLKPGTALVLPPCRSPPVDS